MTMMRLSWVMVVVAWSVVGRLVEGAKFTGQPYFGKDFFLELGPLEKGFGAAGRDVLLKALQEFQGTFETGWETSINAQDTINATFVSLEFAEWFVPELQRADFPVPSQYPSETGDTFLQFMAYRITSITVDGIRNFDLLDQDGYLQAAFASNAFLPFLQAADENGVFSSVTTVTVRALEDFTPTTVFDVGSVSNIPLYLEVATKQAAFPGFGNETAHELVQDLDQFFIDTLGPAIAAGVEAEKPGAKVFMYGSLYTTADYFIYGSYYVGGNVVNQYTTLYDCSKGPVVVTEFLYGFNVWWWKPIAQGDAGRSDIGNFEASVNAAFANSQFKVGPDATALIGTPVSYTGALDEFDQAKWNGTSTDAPLDCPTPNPTATPSMKPTASPSSKPTTASPSSASDKVIPTTPSVTGDTTLNESPDVTSDASNTLVLKNLLPLVMTSAILLATLSLF